LVYVGNFFLFISSSHIYVCNNNNNNAANFGPMQKWFSCSFNLFSFFFWFWEICFLFSL